MGKVIYVVGNEKNVGKTTVVKHLLQQMNNVCVTSIGFDGEETDNITGSPKPLVKLKQNDFVITCERFLDASHFSVIEAIDENLLAGTVVLAQCVLPTHVIIAGATPRAIELATKREYFETLIVDGALDRLVHAGFIDNASIIFVIGVQQQAEAELQRSIERVLRAFQIPLAPQSVTEVFRNCTNVCGLRSTGILEKLSPSLLNNTIPNQDKYEWIFVPGVLLEETVRKFRQTKFCLSNPFSFFANPQKFDNIYTMKKLKLSRIYVNLFEKPWYEEKVFKMVKSYGYEIFDILRADSQEG